MEHDVAVNTVKRLSVQKSTKMIAAFLFDILISSIILRSASICGVVKRPLLNPFGFF